MMQRFIIPIAIGLFFSLSALYAMTQTGGMPDETAEHKFHKHPKQVAWSTDGVFGKFDLQQVQRGYQVYKEVCSACHSLKHVAIRDLAQLGYTEAEVKAEAASWTVPGIDPNTGEATTRPGLPTDYFPSPYANNVAAAAANNNAIPPDLSLIAKARHDGANYVYSLLTGYQEPSEELAKEFPDALPGANLHHNPYFANLNLAMAQPLAADGQVTYAEGNPEPTVDQMSKDVAAFLTWTAEPTMQKRKETGVWFLGFLLFATVLAYLSYRNIWAEKKGH